MYTCQTLRYTADDRWSYGRLTAPLPPRVVAIDLVPDAAPPDPHPRVVRRRGCHLPRTCRQEVRMPMPPALAVRWSAAAFSTADPDDIRVIVGNAAGAIRARLDAADAAMALLVELLPVDDVPVFTSVTIGPDTRSLRSAVSASTWPPTSVTSTHGWGSPAGPYPPARPARDDRHQQRPQPRVPRTVRVVEPETSPAASGLSIWSRRPPSTTDTARSQPPGPLSTHSTSRSPGMNGNLGDGGDEARGLGPGWIESKAD